MRHRADEHVTVEPFTQSLQFDDAARLHQSRAVEADRALVACQPSPQCHAVRPLLQRLFLGRRIGLEQHAVARSEAFRLEVALLVKRGGRSRYLDRLLFLGTPRHRFVLRKLVVGGQFEVEGGDVLAVGHGQHGRAAHFRLLHLNLAAVGENKQAAGIGTREGEVPVGAIVLHERGVLVLRGIHVHTAVGLQYLFYNVAVLLLLEDAVLAPLRGGVGTVAALHYHVRAEVLARKDAQPDDVALEQRFLLVGAARIKFNRVARLEQRIVALIERLLVHIARVEAQRRLADAVQREAHRGGHQREGVGQLAAVAVNGAGKHMVFVL